MKKIKIVTGLGLILTLISTIVALPLQVAFAVEAPNRSNTMSTLRANALSNHEIIFRTPAGAGDSTDTITITFPGGWGMGAFALLNFDLAHSAGGQANCVAPTWTNDEVLATTPSATAWGVAQATQTITFTAPTDGIGVAAIAANACVRIRIGSNATTGGGGVMQLTNHATPGTYSIAIAGTFGNTGNIAVTLITDDQVAVAATVVESLSFIISDPSIGFGTLSTVSARFATGDLLGSGTEIEANNIQVGTNAASGFILTVGGTTLTSGVNTITAIGATNLASAPGSEQFGIRATATGGTGTVSAPYAASGFALDTGAFPDELGASVGPSAVTTYSMRYLANIAALTEAGAYTATLTYIATARF